MAYNYEYPYSNPSQFNVDWLLRKMKELAEEWAAFKPEILAAFDAFKKEVLENEAAHKAEVQALIDAYQAEVNGEIGALKAQMEKILEDFKTFTDEITEKTDGYDEKIAALETSQAEQDTKIASLQTTQQSHGEALATLDQRTGQLETTVTALSGSVSDISASVESLESTVSSHTTAISALQTEQQSLDTRLESAEDSISEIDTQISNLNTSQQQQDAQIATLQTVQQDHETEIGDLTYDNNQNISKINSLDTRVTALEEGGGGGGGAAGPVIDVTTIPGWPASGQSIVNAFNAYTTAHPDHIMYFPAGTYKIDGGLQVPSYTFCDKNVTFNMQNAAAFIGYASANAPAYHWRGGNFIWPQSSPGQSLFYGHEIHVDDVLFNGPTTNFVYLFGSIPVFTANNCECIGPMSVFITAQAANGAAPRIVVSNCRIGAVDCLVEGATAATPNSAFYSCVFSGSSWSNIFLRYCLRTIFVSCHIQIAGVMNYEGDVTFSACSIIWTASMPSGSTNFPSLGYVGCVFNSVSNDPTTMLGKTRSAANSYKTNIIK